RRASGSHRIPRSRWSKETASSTSAVTRTTGASGSAGTRWHSFSSTTWSRAALTSRNTSIVGPNGFRLRSARGPPSAPTLHPRVPLRLQQHEDVARHRDRAGPSDRPRPGTVPFSSPATTPDGARPTARTLAASGPLRDPRSLVRRIRQQDLDFRTWRVAVRLAAGVRVRLLFPRRRSDGRRGLRTFPQRPRARPGSHPTAGRGPGPAHRRPYARSLLVLLLPR